MSKVTIILPNYNHAAFLKKRIESILNQTYQDFDIILMDDCSIDESRIVLNKYSNHPKVSKVFFNIKNSGSTFLQWQRGIQQATGKYIWIAESDDFADILFLQNSVSLLELHPEVGLVYCQSYRVDENGDIICSCKDLYPNIACNKVFKGKEALLNYMVGANLIPNASAVVFRKEIARQIDDTYTKFKFSGDWWFWCEILLRSDIIHIGEELNYFRLHTNKVTVSALKNGLYYTEGLQILELLRQKAHLSYETYVNKSKNYAKAFVESQLNGTTHSTFSIKLFVKVFWQVSKINKIFLRRVFYLILQNKLSKLKMIF